jgi:putative transposase
MGIISFKPGELIRCGGKDYYFAEPIDDTKVVAKNLLTGRKEILEIAAISPVEHREAVADSDLARIGAEQWKIARARYEAIRPLFYHSLEKAVYLKQARLHRVHPATVYDWLNRFRETGLLTSLIPRKRGARKGSKRLQHDVEAILDSAIRELYLSDQKYSPTAVYEEIVLRCRTKGISPPHLNTLRNRLVLISGFDKTRAREGYGVAEEQFTPNEGQLTAEFPLAVVQLDHAYLDLVLVDDESRLPIGRPWITVAFDVCTRTVLGFYLSLDPPGASSVGLCLSRAILKKDQWLMKLKISDLEWPCWGIPSVVHADNAKEFRGEMLSRACAQYGVELNWRPVKKPNWGAHIERYMKVFAERLKTLPGATFSNVEEKGKYDSDKRSAMTISELEHYLVMFICGVYHRKVHSGIGKAPVDAWKQGLFGDKEHPGIGLPRLVADEERFKLDFLPFEERVVNEYGVLIDGIHYYSNVLRPYINSCMPGRYKMRRKFVFRRDPRDISFVYFWDEDNRTHHQIPYRNTAWPPISLWELRAARKHIASQSLSAENEAVIFATLSKLRNLVEGAVQKTRQQRRNAQRKRAHADVHQKGVAEKVNAAPEAEAEDLSKFRAFEDLGGA